jgi:hypothetical protein
MDSEKKSQNNNINGYIWKSNKVLDGNNKYIQLEKKLVLMTEYELYEAYNHCKTMLFNKDILKPGRYLVLDIIAEQKDKCGAELFLRFVDQKNNISRFNLLNMIKEFLDKNKEIFKNYKPLVSDMFSNIPNEYSKISLTVLMDACLDRLGTFNKKQLTRTFILDHGIWLTPSESKDLYEINENGIIRDRLEIIREKLDVKPVEKLFINSKGLNFTQMRAMMNIKPYKKYIDLTTIQLETLRYKVLFNLEETIKRHITSWEKRMEEIEEVVEFKGFRL